MKIEILNYTANEKGIRKGFVDFKVTHDLNKWEIFRDVIFFQKDSRRWLSVGNCQRDNKWIPKYEREPNLKGLLLEALSELIKYLN